MSLFKSLANAIPDTKALPMVTGTRNDAYLAPNINALPSLGTGVTLYPSDTGQTYINKGYKRNAIVFSIVNKCIKKFGQVDWNVVKIVSDERKTAQEYLELSRKDLSVPAVRELKKMRKKMIDQVPVDNPLSKRLARPNRNQSQAEFLEQLYGYKLLTGEANIWLSRGTENGVPITKGQPLELQAIPKENLLLVKGGDAWDIRGFEIAFGGERIPTPKENIIMWAFFNPSFNPNTLDHLRGMAPLDSAILLAARLQRRRGTVGEHEQEPGRCRFRSPRRFGYHDAGTIAIHAAAIRHHCTQRAHGWEIRRIWRQVAGASVWYGRESIAAFRAAKRA
jgi:hypothetical protein